MYANIKSCVTVNGFSLVTMGLDRGENLSPDLFSLILNDLEDHLLADQVYGIPGEYKILI